MNFASSGIKASERLGVHLSTLSAMPGTSIGSSSRVGNNGPSPLGSLRSIFWGNFHLL